MTAALDVVTALLGDYVDVEKMGPDPSEVHTPGLIAIRTPRKRRVRKDESAQRKVAEGVGLGATAIGTGYGVRELAQEIPHAYPGTQAARVATGLTTRLGRLKGVKVGSKGKVGLAAALLAGDATATAVLGSKPKQSVEKAIPLNQLRAGRLASMARMLGHEPDAVLAGGEKAKAARTARATVPKSPRQVAQASKPRGNVPPVSVPGSPRPPASAGTPAPPTNAAPKVAPVPRGPVTSSARGPLSPGQTAAMTDAASARAGLDQMIGTRTGKIVLGGTAASGLVSNRRAKTKGYNEAVYGKSASVDVGIEGTFSKFDDEKRRAYGWASVVTMDGEPVVDRQGDYIGLEDIEEAAYTYVRKSRVAGDMHRRTHDDQPLKTGELIESVVFTPDKCHAMGLPASFAGKWWMGVQVEDDEQWQEVKKGNRTGFSIHGKGIRKDTTLDEIRAGR